MPAQVTSATPMPRSIVTGAGFLVALAAALGLYLGVTRSLASAGGLARDEADVAAVTPVSSAKPLASASVTDEVEIRRMAREEAEAVFAKAHKPAPAPAKKPDDDDDDDTAAKPPPPVIVAPPATAAPSAPPM